MSLKIWLPLNGNIENQGLADVTITNNGATIDNNGKIGKCYSFNGSSSRISTSALSISTPISMCAWIKPTNVSKSNTQYILSYNTATSGTDGHLLGIGFYGNSQLTLWAGGSLECSSTSLSNNTWYHVAATYNGSSAKLYVNGECVLTRSVTERPTSTWFTIGGRSNSSTGGTGGAAYFYQGYINDVHLYDEALSADQIKEISRGMVLHYKMCQPERSENLLANGAATEITCRSKNPDYPLKAIRTTLENNTQYTLSFDAKSDNGLGTYYCSLANGGSSQIYFATKIKPTTKYKHFVYTATRGTQTTNNILFAAYYGWSENANVTDTIHIKNVKLEKGSNPNATFSPPSTETLNWGTIEYDGSGFKNHGTVSGNVTLSADSPRYIGSYLYSDSTSGYISVPQNSLEHIFTNKVITISLWINPISNNCRKMILGMKNSYNINIEIISSNDNNIRFYWNKTDWSPGISCPKDTWTYLVFVIESNSVKIYKNGSLAGTKNSVNWPTTGTGEWLIGSDQRIGTYFLGSKVSDFRIYSTALDATDVAELYKLGK